ncbi:MAG TPA: class II histone deacetylase [Thermomicrobiales bacterium]|nr:class II histone deacetylase [Thermomicrobiales bacterium]
MTDARAAGRGANDERPVGLVFDDRYLTHNTGLALIGDRHQYPFAHPVAHPSSPELVGRAKHLMDLHGVSDRMTRIAPRLATDDDLLVYHTLDYLARVAALSAAEGGDTGDGAPIGPGGDRIARVSAGGTMAAVDAVLSGDVRAAYALVRPPGHHAMADHGKGFCVYNNVVVAARHAQRVHGVGKVLIVDWDVHHGNGTQDAFWRDPSALFVSLHQDNLFPPDWGALDQVGEDAGRGFTVNVPLPAGTGNAGYLAAFDRIVTPIARQFAPELIFISAGQDANVMDPLARMCVTLDGFRGMMARLQAVANDCCDGRIVITQEGGYAAAYAPYCSAAVAETLVGLEPGAAPIADPYGPRAESLPPSRDIGLDCEHAIERILEMQRAFWRV